MIWTSLKLEDQMSYVASVMRLDTLIRSIPTETSKVRQKQGLQEIQLMGDGLVREAADSNMFNYKCSTNFQVPKEIPSNVMFV